jgi:hypothetical protein
LCFCSDADLSLNSSPVPDISGCAAGNCGTSAVDGIRCVSGTCPGAVEVAKVGIFWVESVGCCDSVLVVVSGNRATIGAGGISPTGITVLGTVPGFTVSASSAVDSSWVFCELFLCLKKVHMMRIM